MLRLSLILLGTNAVHYIRYLMVCKCRYPVGMKLEIRSYTKLKYHCIHQHLVEVMQSTVFCKTLGCRL